MTERMSVEVSRRIPAPPARIFAVVADPSRHPEFDGTGMLRGPVFDRPISGVGDVFAMKMDFEALGGEYLMLNHVVEYEPDRRIFWDPAPGDPASAGGEAFSIGVPAGHRWGFVLTPEGGDATVVTEIFDCADAPEELRAAVRHGEQWLPAMTESLARLEAICTVGQAGRSASQSPAGR